MRRPLHALEVHALLEHLPQGRQLAQAAHVLDDEVGHVVHLLLGVEAADAEADGAVGQVVAERLPATIILALVCHLLASFLGIGLGILAATRQYSWVDTTLGIISFLGMTIPRFLLAIIILYFLVFRLNVSEVGMFFSARYGGAPWSWDKFVDLLSHLWIPIVVIGTNGTAALIRILRANLTDELSKPYVITAKAKGLPEYKVVLKYPVRIALNPFVSAIGWVLPELVSGVTITAIVLNLPMLGPMLLRALTVQDMYLAGSIILLLGVLTLIGMLISDLLLALLDPRIRFT